MKILRGGLIVLVFPLLVEANSNGRPVGNTSMEQVTSDKKKLTTRLRHDKIPSAVSSDSDKNGGGEGEDDTMSVFRVDRLDGSPIADPQIHLRQRKVLDEWTAAKKWIIAAEDHRETTTVAEEAAEGKAIAEEEGAGSAEVAAAPSNGESTIELYQGITTASKMFHENSEDVAYQRKEMYNKQTDKHDSSATHQLRTDQARVSDPAPSFDLTLEVVARADRTPSVGSLQCADGPGPTCLSVGPGGSRSTCAVLTSLKPMYKSYGFDICAYDCVKSQCRVMCDECGSQMCQEPCMDQAAFNALGWTKVRHVPSGHSWHPASDKLHGTAVYGNKHWSPNHPWSINFEAAVPSYNEFLFATGNFHKWLVSTKADVRVDNYSNEPRWIIESEGSLGREKKYEARWYNRANYLGDPWISISDHSTAIGKKEIIYGENSINLHTTVLWRNNGADVYVRRNPYTPKTAIGRQVRMVNWIPKPDRDRDCEGSIGSQLCGRNSEFDEAWQFYRNGVSVLGPPLPPRDFVRTAVLLLGFVPVLGDAISIAVAIVDIANGDGDAVINALTICVGIVGLVSGPIGGTVADVAGTFSKVNSAAKGIAGKVKYVTGSANFQRLNRARTVGSDPAADVATKILAMNTWVGMHPDDVAVKLDEIEKQYSDALWKDYTAPNRLIYELNLPPKTTDPDLIKRLANTCDDVSLPEKIKSGYSTYALAYVVGVTQYDQFLQEFMNDIEWRLGELQWRLVEKIKKFINDARKSGSACECESVRWLIEGILDRARTCRVLPYVKPLRFDMTVLTGSGNFPDICMMGSSSLNSPPRSYCKESPDTISAVADAGLHGQASFDRNVNLKPEETAEEESVSLVTSAAKAVFRSKTHAVIGAIIFMYSI